MIPECMGMLGGGFTGRTMHSLACLFFLLLRFFTTGWHYFYSFLIKHHRSNVVILTDWRGNLDPTLGTFCPMYVMKELSHL